MQGSFQLEDALKYAMKEEENFYDILFEDLKKQVIDQKNAVHDFAKNKIPLGVHSATSNAGGGDAFLGVYESTSGSIYTDYSMDDNLVQNQIGALDASIEIIDGMSDQRGSYIGSDNRL